MLGTKNIAVVGAQNTPSTIPHTSANPTVSASYTAALMTADSTASTFLTDASPANTIPKAVSFPSNAAFNPFNGSYYSNYFDGSSYIAGPSSAAYTLGTGDFTVEAWIYSTVAFTSTTRLLSQNTGGMSLYPNSTGNIVYAPYGGASAITSSSTITANAWYHIAVSRVSGTTLMFINGAQVGSVADTNNYTSTNFLIGTDNGTNKFTGFVSNARLINGSGIYTGAFTPSTTPLTAVTNTALLTCQSARFIDNSTNNATITLTGTPTVSPVIPFTLPSTTNGSAYFNPSTRASMANWAYNQNFNLGTTWTMECWIYPTVGGASSRIMGMEGNVVANFAQFFLSINASNQLVLTNRPTTGGAVSSITGTVNLIRMNEWTHVAACNNAGVCKIFINGVLNGTNNSFPAFGDPTLFVGFGGSANGTYQAGVDWFPGYISNVRIVKNSALYTASFTPPTSPLTADANTVLLTAQYNAPTRNNTITDSGPLSLPLGVMTGTQSQSAISPFVGSYGTSLSFPDTATSASLILLPNNNANLAFGTGDFTVEAWVYPTTATATMAIFAGQGDAATIAGSSYVFYITSGAATSDLYVGGTSYAITSPNAPRGKWSHVAYVRNGTSWKSYLNGVQVGSTTLAANASVNAGATTTFPNIAGVNNSGTFAGFMSNFRVVKGTAVYTGNFTPPTSPLTAISGTVLLTANSLLVKDYSTAAIPFTFSTYVPNVSNKNPFSSYPYSGGTSAYFTSSYIATPANPSYALPADFTVEFWVYPTAVASAQCTLFGMGPLASANNGVEIYIDTNGSINMYSNGAGIITGAANLIKNNQWYHIAAVRIGTALTIYVNGVSAGTATNSTSFAGNATAGLSVGGVYTAAGAWSATGSFYMANLRIVRSGVYTTTFTPPTTPVTAIANTVLLLNFGNGALVDYAGNNMLLFSGTAQVQSNSKKYGTGAMYFDGTASASAYIPDSANTPYLSTRFPADFTVEFWMMRTGSAGVVKGLTAKGGATSGWYVGIDASNHINITETTTTTAGTATIADNVWYHIALVKIGTSLKLYVNGVQDISVTSSSAAAYILVTNLYIGANRTNTANFVGYIDDYRITNGVGRYTANFVVPQRGFNIYD